jgi:Kef-type K+ transport system membrane component KefB/nucleotide-binding universal stress UspA family protein
MVLMEVGFIRRDLGQLILATAILDDSIAWIIVSVIAGMAARGSIDLGQIGFSIVAAVVFLGVSLTLGRRLVALLIRWSNDNLSIDFPVVTTVLVVTFAMALMTDLIGVHSALGAFIAGVIIGQSPILKGHIEQELRGLILAFFSPVFFAVAGLGMDLTTLADPAMLGLALAFVAVASLGKTAGALMGGHLAGLSWRESLALATGLNARGSTEVIIATIGLSLGVLSEPLYTLIVAMAIITTMAMPPTLRWALTRVPMRDEERVRLEKEEAAENDYLPAMERVLVLADRSANAGLVLGLAGAFAAGQQIQTTILEEQPEAGGADDPATDRGTERARAAAEQVDGRLAGGGAGRNAGGEEEPAEARAPAESLIRSRALGEEDSAETEAAKGYNMLFAGLSDPLEDDGRHFRQRLAAVLDSTDLPVAIGLGGRSQRAGNTLPRHILVPTDGTQVAKLATEIAVALARASGAKLTVLHVVEQQAESVLLRRTLPGPEESVLHQAEILAGRHGVTAELREVIHSRPGRVIRAMSTRGVDLVIVAANLRQDSARFLGPRTSAVIREVRVPILLIAR